MCIEKSISNAHMELVLSQLKKGHNLTVYATNLHIYLR